MTRRGIRIHVVRQKFSPEGFDVWVSLPEVATNELFDAGESFIIGTGTTRLRALLEAAHSLLGALEDCFTLEGKRNGHQPK